jgi:hypothetical protein
MLVEEDDGRELDSRSLLCSLLKWLSFARIQQAPRVGHQLTGEKPVGDKDSQKKKERKQTLCSSSFIVVSLSKGRHLMKRGKKKQRDEKSENKVETHKQMLERRREPFWKDFLHRLLMFRVCVVSKITRSTRARTAFSLQAKKEEKARERNEEMRNENPFSSREEDKKRACTHVVRELSTDRFG